jgi:hypothetical protein
MIWIERKAYRPSIIYYRFLVILNDVKDLKQCGMILRQAQEPSLDRLGNLPSRCTAVSMHKIPHCVRDDNVALEEGALGHDSH